MRYILLLLVWFGILIIPNLNAQSIDLGLGSSAWYNFHHSFFHSSFNAEPGSRLPAIITLGLEYRDSTRVQLAYWSQHNQSPADKVNRNSTRFGTRIVRGISASAYLRPVLNKHRISFRPLVGLGYLKGSQSIIDVELDGQESLCFECVTINSFYGFLGGQARYDIFKGLRLNLQLEAMHYRNNHGVQLNAHLILSYSLGNIFKSKG